MKKHLLIIISLITVFSFSCKKDEGKGGRASIKGRVYAKDYNQSFSQLLNEYYAPEEDVYIIYGENENYDDRVRTGPDGTFEFKHLRKGSYTIYVYTKDSTFTIPSGVQALSVDAEIVDKEEIVEVPTFNILK